jgi:hypothetical protein
MKGGVWTTFENIGKRAGIKPLTLEIVSLFVP